MKNVLSRVNRTVLEEFACSNVLLAFDYDGTLAPIVPKPEDARMRAGTRELLSQLTQHYPVIVISGRSQADALERVRGVGVLEVVGNHGMEPGYTASRHIAQVRSWLSHLGDRLSPFKGVALEDKTYSLAIHYRHSREKKKARAAIRDAIDTLGQVRVLHGKQVVNVLPVDAPHKGLALERARERLRCDTAVYVGDDETDEDVFALDQPGQLLSIRVGARQGSAATYCIDRQRTIDELLRALLRYRRDSTQRRYATR